MSWDVSLGFAFTRAMFLWQYSWWGIIHARRHWKSVYLPSSSSVCVCSRAAAPCASWNMLFCACFNAFNLHYLSTFLAITETTGQGQPVPFVKSIPFCNMKATEEEGTHGRLVASKDISLFRNSWSSCTLCCIDGKNANDALHILCTVLNS